MTVNRLKKSWTVAAAKARRNSAFRVTDPSATNVDVMVVPMLAPMMNGTALVTVSAPADTNPTTKAVVVDELWIKLVARIPMKSPMNGFVVELMRALARGSPATLKPVSMSPMLNKKI